MEYRPRIADGELSSRLKSAGAVLIKGPKACGKTATARRQAASEVRLDVDAQQRAAAEVTPDLVLDQPAPLLIDEWQLVPDIWAHVRRAVDDRGARGQFILTGSATPSDDAARHSGAGGSASCACGPCAWPSRAPAAQLCPWTACSIVPRRTRRIPVDIHAVSGKRRDPAKVNAVMRSLARNTSAANPACWPLSPALAWPIGARTACTYSRSEPSDHEPVRSASQHSTRAVALHER